MLIMTKGNCSQNRHNSDLIKIAVARILKSPTEDGFHDTSATDLVIAIHIWCSSLCVVLLDMYI